MKKIFFLYLFTICHIVVSAQINIRESKSATSYLNFLPSNASFNELRSSDIPSEQVLMQMGFSDDQIKQALDFKYSRGIYANSSQDTILKKTSPVERFYENFSDTIFRDTVIYPEARIYGQNIFRNNRLKFFQKALDAKAPENYKVGPGDEISVSVWGLSDFSEKMEVDDRGYINPNSYGRIYVKGLSFKKMRSMLKSKFSSFLEMKGSEIDVTLSYSRVITVNIVGEVYNPGSYTIPAINTAFNALIAAKGPNQIGSVRNIYIRRNGNIVDSLDIYEFLFNPIRSRDIYMQDGDYIFVPPAKNVVEVIGAVNRPYTYEIKNGESVSDVINYSGSFSDNAFREIITLKRWEYDAINIKDVYYDHLSKTDLKNGDVIVVNSVSNKISNVVTIKTSVGVEGEYEYKPGERLLDLLNRAHCIGYNTFLQNVYIIRMNDDRTKTHISVDLQKIISDPKHKDNIIIKEFDVIRVLSIDDFEDNFTVSVEGAVRNEVVLDFGDGMSLKDALLQAGGLTQEAEGSRIQVSRIMNYDIKSNKLTPIRTVIETIKVEDDLSVSKHAAEFLLQPYDQVFVRLNPNFQPVKNVVILGEVKYPGTYSVKRKSEQISSLINRAGGLTDHAYLDGSKMFRRFRNSEKKLNSNDLFKHSSDSIVLNSDIEKKLNQIFQKEDNYIYDAVYLNMSKALSSSGSKHNLVLMEGDSIIIPKTLDLVHITGDLINLEGNSISAPHFNRRRAHYYVNNFAGGYTRANKKSNTVVIYPNGIARKTMNFGLFTLSPVVKEGATIKVYSKIPKNKEKRKNIVDWNRQIENGMLKLSAVLTLWVLVSQVSK